MLMRPVVMDDLVTLARTLLHVAPEARAQVARRIVARAQAAYLWYATTNTPHPRWGGGTLSDACVGWSRATAPRAKDPAFRDCLVQACLAVNAAQPDAQVTQVGRDGS